MPCACCRIAFERDTKVPNAGTFTLQREDHTVGNLVRMCVGWSSCRVAARVPRHWLRRSGAGCARRSVANRHFVDHARLQAAAQR